ncbi:hypothetical protein Q5P01_023971 [Channa striata]|uniref:Uncharacterized protein n=1 Tax=Channa striata TaxID=64152 RepID=A0AA88LQM7_CHASR|nr:hypothetical protein Q5P01_023971 [Channa striata]
MSETIQVLRAFVSQRLTVAVEEIIGVLERTITEYEAEIERQRRLLGANRHRHTGESADIQRLPVSADIAPKLLCIKEKPEDAWSTQGPEAANTSQTDLRLQHH